jgi:hypothetical protein
VTVTPRELAHASELRSALAELNNAAHAARPYVEAAAFRSPVLGSPALTLERLDAALADAGDVLERSSS